MPLTPDQALADINRAGTQGNFRVSQSHCVPRMKQRGAKWDDLRHGLTIATSCTLQPNGRWKVPSFDLDGDDLVLIVVLEDDVWVVTIF
jgi:hypothetical protein